MTNRFDDAWRAFAERDRTRLAPPYLEARVLNAVRQSRLELPSRTGRWRWPAAFAAATIAIALGVTLRDRSQHAPAPLTARSHAPLPLPAAIAPVRPRISPAPPVRRDEERLVLVMLDSTPALESEPLQLVRLRIPKEALFGLGVALFEHDAGGMVDVDVLVGEDGLPRDVRKVRVGQEDRR